MTADKLRDELAEAFQLARYTASTPMTEAEICQYLAGAALPVVRRYADAQVAVERQHLADLVNAAVGYVSEPEGSGDIPKYWTSLREAVRQYQIKRRTAA
jgi:hypothetical protein